MMRNTFIKILPEMLIPIVCRIVKKNCERKICLEKKKKKKKKKKEKRKRKKYQVEETRWKSGLAYVA